MTWIFDREIRNDERATTRSGGYRPVDTCHGLSPAARNAAVSVIRVHHSWDRFRVLGVMPLLWEPFFKSLAVTIIAGLSFATILTLLAVPTLYVVFF